MAALRSAVHALHGECERQESNSSDASWQRSTPLQSAVARLGLATPGEAASDRLVALLGQLRLATIRYVVELRADGESPEHMLVRVKDLVRDVLTDEGWFDRTATRPLTAAVVVWSIDAYYGR